MTDVIVDLCAQSSRNDCGRAAARCSSDWKFSESTAKVDVFGGVEASGASAGSGGTGLHGSSSWPFNVTTSTL